MSLLHTYNSAVFVTNQRPCNTSASCRSTKRCPSRQRSGSRGHVKRSSKCFCMTASSPASKEPAPIAKLWSQKVSACWESKVFTEDTHRQTDRSEVLLESPDDSWAHLGGAAQAAQIAPMPVKHASAIHQTVMTLEYPATPL